MFYMNAEFIAMLDYLERERGIKREILLEAVSNALLSASKKSVGASRDLRIDINRKTGEIRALANLVVVDQVTNPQDEIELSRARKIKSDANVGEIIEVEVTPKNFGRIAAQTAKQAMMQRISTVPSAISLTSNSNRRRTKFGWLRETIISGPRAPFSTATTYARRRSPTL